MLCLRPQAQSKSALLLELEKGRELAEGEARELRKKLDALAIARDRERQEREKEAASWARQRSALEASAARKTQALVHVLSTASQWSTAISTFLQHNPHCQLGQDGQAPVDRPTAEVEVLAGYEEFPSETPRAGGGPAPFRDAPSGPGELLGSQGPWKRAGPHSIVPSQWGSPGGGGTNDIKQVGMSMCASKVCWLQFHMGTVHPLLSSLPGCSACTTGAITE